MDQAHEITIATPDPSNLSVTYINHADLALAPHHLELTLSYWSFPLDEPSTPAAAVVAPEPLLRVAVPAAFLPELIGLLHNAHEAHQQLQTLVDDPL